MTRDNKGWDVGAWKNGMNYWDDQLSKFDLVAFVNNSCVYLFDLYMFFSKAMGYDMYGVTHMSDPNPYHLSAIFIVFSKKLYKSDVFRQHWNNLRDDSDRHYAVVNELSQTKKFLEQGYKIGVYDQYNGTDLLYRDYDKNRQYGREFIKKTNIKHVKKKDIDEQIEKVLQHNASNGYV
jgi:lipopolysaccharide biosynthesis protein